MKNFSRYIVIVLCLLMPVSVFAQDIDSIVRQLDSIQNTLNEVTIKAERMKEIRLKSVEGTVIFEGKKTEIVDLSKLQANLATNNGRQVFNRIAGLNVWESDAAGMQLGIGARGLNPNRSAEFNIRQNGYDITADAIGYPDAYFTPPLEGMDRVEIVRGAASLQFGTQFGGLINFKTHQPIDKKFQLTTQLTGGSFATVSSFTAIEGTYKKFSYYAYYQYKHTKGWRPNSKLNAHSAFINLTYHISPKVSLSAEYTHQNYVMQQPGGLTDNQFKNDPRQSTRTRNWFGINWNIPVVKLEYFPKENLRWNTILFGLIGSRNALGFLSYANRNDDFKNRDLIKDKYKNFGMESRFLYQYKMGKDTSSLSVGVRYFHGFTTKQQGLGSDASDADFDYLNPNNLENSDYHFYGNNIALSAENIFKITPKLSITPGVRLEFLLTDVNGYYKADTVAYDDSRKYKRIFPLFGVGISFKAHHLAEVYANISQNYRGINYTDLRINNPNVRVDPNIKDEKGFNADIGIRGKKGEQFNYDVNFFTLYYNKKVGSIQQVDSQYNIYRFKTNISNSRSLGVESFVEVDIVKCINENSDFGTSLFSNFTYTNALYIKSQNKQIEGNVVEFAPQFIFRGGVRFKYKDFACSWQISTVSKQFTDATNAKYASTAVIGEIPHYYVMDFNASYAYKWFKFSCSVNNLSNNKYFTRRAESYPGPGIIPSDGISAFGTIAFRWHTKE
ncbi:MAG: TonB-dependent receptor plug domain-containing protein [Bacteroidetes bacterium]|nr:TonB-dependent receptor plug domain-containing protein [Bacteroidota bacterium]